MSNIPQVPGDPRNSPHTLQTYHVTFGGRPRETGVSYSSRLSASYEANFQWTIPLDGLVENDLVVAEIPPFVWGNKLVVLEGGGGTCSVQFLVGEVGNPGSAAALTVGDVSLTSSMDAHQAFDQKLAIEVEPVDQILVAKVAAGAAGTGHATVVFPMTIVQTGWK